MSLRRITAALGAAAMAITTAACSPSTPDHAANPNIPKVGPALPVPTLGPGQSYVLDPWELQLDTYDDARGRVVATSYGNDEFFYYSFHSASHLYTSGYNEKPGSSIVRVEPHAVRTVVRMKDDEQVFPLATDGHDSFFVVYEYSAPGVESGRRIVRLRSDGSLQTYQTFTGPHQLVSDGALLHGRLYYPVGDQDKDVDTLYSLAADDPTPTPRLERTGLKSSEVYAQGGKLLLSDGTTLTDGRRRFTCNMTCWFYDEPAVLVAVTDEGGAYVLKVIDATNGHTLHQVLAPVGFDLTGHMLTVWTTDGIKHIKLGKADAA
jgi:hypothetical protein